MYPPGQGNLFPNVRRAQYTAAMRLKQKTPPEKGFGNYSLTNTCVQLNVIALLAIRALVLFVLAISRQEWVL
jgi:hypothetical protein